MSLSFLLAPLCALIALESPHPWQEVRRDAQVTVWARQVPDSPIREVRAQSVVEAPPERVWDVLADIEHYTDFMPYVIEAYAFGANALRRFEYYRIAPPLVSARDYTIRVELETDAAAGSFVRRWRIANELGPGPRDDAVRLAVCDGSWTVQRRPAGQSLLTYHLYTDPAGAIPGWLANRANRTSVPDLLEAVRRRAVDPSWPRG